MNPTLTADPYATSHLSNQGLLADFGRCVAQDHKSFAVTLTRIAEIDERRLYRAEGYSCMKAFLMDRMTLPEGAAYKRLTTARLARQYPGILVDLAEGRLHMRAVLMLGPHLSSGNADELVRAARGKTRFELEVLLAQRVPRPDTPDRIEAIVPVPTGAQPAPAESLAPERVEATIPYESVHGHAGLPSPASSPSLAPERVASFVPRARVTPLSPQRYGFQGTWDQEGYELYHEVRALVSHQVPSGELSLVLTAALRIAKAQLEKRTYGATGRPRRSPPTGSDGHIPATVRRAVRARDGNRCSFVSDRGKRCEETRFLQFDHVIPKARGGTATAENTRLYCRAHNQHAADREFGSDFMDRKRREARSARR